MKRSAFYASRSTGQTETVLLARSSCSCLDCLDWVARRVFTVGSTLGPVALVKRADPVWETRRNT
jgi:hypothetical protein